MKKLMAIYSLLVLPVTSATAASISFAQTDLVATVQTIGHYDNAGLGIWNGNPVSSTNQPTYDQDQLSATWNFYVPHATTNELFVEVTNVQDTTWGWISGVVFQYVALTEFGFSVMPTTGSQLQVESFSNAWARPGEKLDGPAVGGVYQQVPLDTTPGWNLTQPSGNGSYQISTNDVGTAFSHFGNITGTSRITGGGMFELVFQPGTDLYRDADFTTLAASARHGLSTSLQYQAAGTLTYALTPSAVPEPETYALFMSGMALIGAVARRKAKKTQ